MTAHRTQNDPGLCGPGHLRSGSRVGESLRIDARRPAQLGGRVAPPRGRRNPVARLRSARQFKDGDAPVFVINLKAVGFGLNLIRLASWESLGPGVSFASQ